MLIFFGMQSILSHINTGLLTFFELAFFLVFFLPFYFDYIYLCH